MSKALDLDKLEELEREATPGPWAGFNFTDIFTDDDAAARGEPGTHIADMDPSGDKEVAKVKADRDLVTALRNAAPAIFAELRAARECIAELEKNARLGSAVREAAEQAGDITDVEVLRDVDLCRGGYLGSLVITECQFDVLCAIDSALREEGEEALNA